MRLAAVLILILFTGVLFAEEPVRVIAFGENGRQLRSARAVLLDDQGFVATVRSVLVGARRLELVSADGTRQPVRWVAAEDPGAGIVKLWVERGAGRAPKFNSDAPEPKSTVRMEGKAATVRTVRDIPGSGVVAELEATADEGQAGSAVLDHEERVAGLLVPQFLGTRNVAYSVPISRVFELPSQPLLTVEEWAANHNRSAEEAYQLGLGQIWAENYDSAVRNLEEAVISQPGFAEAWFHLGLAHAKLGRAAAKIRAFQKAIAVRPNYAEAHYSLGIAFLLQGSGAEANQEVEALRAIGALTLADKLSELIEGAHVDTLGHDHDKT